MRTVKWIGISIILAALMVVGIHGSFGDQRANGTYLTIVQTEFERDGTELRQVSNNRVLLPVAEDLLTAENTLLKKDFSVTDRLDHVVNVSLLARADMYSAENVLDHIVVVTNTGNHVGYVRTWFVFEMGQLTAEEFKASVEYNKNVTDWEWGNVEYGVVIGGQRCAVVCAVHPAQLNPGETTSPSLLQILLKSGVSNDLVDRLDGNRDGLYEVRAYSQVVSDDRVWGQVTNQPWNKPQTTE